MAYVESVCDGISPKSLQKYQETGILAGVDCLCRSLRSWGILPTGSLSLVRHRDSVKKTVTDLIPWWHQGRRHKEIQDVTSHGESQQGGGRQRSQNMHWDVGPGELRRRPLAWYSGQEIGAGETADTPEEKDTVESNKYMRLPETH